MKKQFTKRLIISIVRYALGGVFVVAGFSKLFPFKGFLEQLLAYQLPFAKEFLFYAALFLILLEIVIGLSVLLNFYLKWGLIGIQVLLVFMIPFTIWGSVHQAPSCGCYGNLVQREPWKATVEDLLMLAISLLLNPFVKRKPENKRTEAYKAIFIGMAALASLVFGAFQLRECLQTLGA